MDFNIIQTTHKHDIFRIVIFSKIAITLNHWKYTVTCGVNDFVPTFILRLGWLLILKFENKPPTVSWEWDDCFHDIFVVKLLGYTFNISS